MYSDQQFPNRPSPKSPKKGQLSRKNSFTTNLIKPLAQQPSTLPLNRLSRQNSIQQTSSILQDTTSVGQQNKRLRRKLKQLSQRLDQQLQRAAQNKMKMQNLSKLQHPNKPQSQSLQLQNAYKMIQRLQKTVKDFQNKQSYQVSVKRIMDLESIIKKKQSESQQLKQQIKTGKKIIREKQKLINQLLSNAQKDKNVTEDKEVIERMKKKIKKLTEDHDQLRKKELTKHQQLVKAERKIVEMEQDGETPIGREEALVKQLEEYKKKYKDSMTRIDRLNLYVAKLNQKLDKEGGQKTKGRYSEGDKSRREVSKSMDELPNIKMSKVKPITELLEKHLPSPKVPVRLKRY